ncbi:uncharacterized protein TRUGW13939_07398 [Talaromyces rugulosus]|uniref:Uncharacterized protein n=1 Tax=Talaromyces rugulosus TaxID=121627 RepID=A0A7H8R3N0_TALRU|nr:uncharacterized protein TRUGW13939_07398 [Talaromyces rugulosus]QKX60255.1 hypothetical protein TRUGW13939_07398 [Talaromyces rugulosus]
MLWMIRLLAVANLALALPKALLHPARDHGGLAARQASPSRTPSPNVVTHWSTKVVKSTYTITPTSTPIPTSAVASTPHSSIPPPANPAVHYITVTVTDPVYQTITVVAGQAVETIYETVTTRVAAETYHIVVMYITSIKTVVLPTATRTIFGTGASSVLTPAKRFAQRWTRTLPPFTKVPPITQPSSIVTSQAHIPIIPTHSPIYDTDTNTTPTTAPPTTRHYSTTTKTATPPVISTVYTTVRPTIVQTVRQANSSTISSIVTVTVTETTGTTTVRSTSPIAVTLTDYAVVGIYPTGGYPVTSIVSSPVNKLRYF